MQLTVTFLMLKQIVAYSHLFATLFYVNSVALPTGTFIKGDWSLISIPTVPGIKGKTKSLFSAYLAGLFLADASLAGVNSETRIG